MTKVEMLEAYLELLKNRRTDVSWRYDQKVRAVDTQGIMFRGERNIRYALEKSASALELEAELNTLEEVIKDLESIINHKEV